MVITSNESSTFVTVGETLSTKNARFVPTGFLMLKPFRLRLMVTTRAIIVSRTAVTKNATCATTASIFLNVVSAPTTVTTSQKKSASRTVVMIEPRNAEAACIVMIWARCERALAMIVSVSTLALDWMAVSTSRCRPTRWMT